MIHLTLYYDADKKDVNNNCWCVKFSNSNTVYCFPTLVDAQLYITENSWHFMPDIIKK